MLHSGSMDLYGRLIQKVVFPAWEAARGRPTIEHLAFLKRTQWASHDELQALQLGKLRRLLRHAYDHTRWYRRVFDERGVRPDDIRSVDDLARLPVLERAHMQADNERFRTDAGPPAAVKKATSGSTGEPFVFEYNAESRHWRDAMRLRAYEWAGYPTGARSLHYWGIGIGKPAAKKKLKATIDRGVKRERFVDCTPRGDDHLARVVATIRADRPEVIVTYSQAGADLARYVIRTGARDWPDIPVICGAERLFDADREALGRAFGPAFETYGAREFMLMGAECDAHDGLHTAMENLIIEVVVRNDDGTARAAQPGETGDLIVTDLHNLHMPFIRYLNGDMAVQRKHERCRCGRELHRIGPIEGRIAETMRDGKGGRVSGLLFNIVFVEISDVARQFQVVQHLDDSLTLKLVMREPGPIPDAKLALLRTMFDRYLPGLPWKPEMVDDIPVTAAGKRRVVVVEKPGVTAR
jgi:phenylacetate-CoA ligase